MGFPALCFIYQWENKHTKWRIRGRGDRGVTPPWTCPDPEHPCRVCVTGPMTTPLECPSGRVLVNFSEGGWRYEGNAQGVCACECPRGGLVNFGGGGEGRWRHAGNVGGGGGACECLHPPFVKTSPVNRLDVKSSSEPKYHNTRYGLYSLPVLGGEMTLMKWFEYKL